MIVLGIRLLSNNLIGNEIKHIGMGFRILKTVEEWLLCSKCGKHYIQALTTVLLEVFN